MNSKPGIHVCLMQPENQVHAGALLDPALYFHHQFRRLGAEPSFERNRLRHDAVNFVFGAHLGFDPAWLNRYSCIIVNLEQIGQGGAKIPSAYNRLLRTAIMADYDARNPAVYASNPEDVPIFSFGHAAYLWPEAERALPLEKRPVDVLFLGSVNERRLALIRRIEAMGRTVHVQQTPVYGSARNNILRQAKALLNLHFYDSARFEQVRAFVSLSNGTPVISERHPDSEPGSAYDACVTWLDESFMELFFAEEFGSPLFYQVMTQQLDAFRQVDPLDSYAELLDFAAGVWKAHGRVLSLASQSLQAGPLYPSELLPGDANAAEDWGVMNVDRGEFPRSQVIDDVDHQIAQIVAKGQYDLALRVLAWTVNTHHHQPGIINHALYYPRLDCWLKVLAEKLAEAGTGSGSASLGTAMADALRPTMVIASELYTVGGHSRLLESLVENVPNPVVVLTDAFMSYQQSPSSADWLRERLKGVELIILEGNDPWKKAEALHAVVERTRPSHIWYLQHQQDAVAFVGTLSFKQTPKIMIHHSDHNPSLGCTLPDLLHVDITETLQQVCEHHLERECFRLPLYTPDLGVKSWPASMDAKEVSVVTAGRAGKFVLAGPVALQRMVASALKVVGGRFYHVGAISSDSVSIIRQYLKQEGINPRRFVSLGQVPSLWGCLKSLDAQVYIGSAPFSGGTSAVEAQGCGYPVLPFSGFEEGSLIADYSSYADMTLGWRDVDELATRLQQVVPRLKDLSDKARCFYEQGFSRAVFAARVDAIAKSGQAAAMRTRRGC